MLYAGWVELQVGSSSYETQQCSIAALGLAKGLDPTYATVTAFIRSPQIVWAAIVKPPKSLGGNNVLLVQTGAQTAERKVGVMTIVLYILSGAFVAIMMMHFHVRPSPPDPPGFRLFGFPRPRKS